MTEGTKRALRKADSKETAIARRDDLAINKRDGFDFDYGYDRIQETLKLCESIAQSGMVPREYQNAPRKILVAAAMGARFGLDPLQSLQSIAVVNGTPTFYGDSLLGMVKSSGKEEWTLEGVKAMEYAKEESDIYAQWIKHYDYKPSKIAFCVTKRKDEDEPTIQYYTIDQAKDAGLLTKDNWKKHPMRMLQMRARSYALRDAYADVLKGYKTYEEMRDVDAEEYHEPLPESTGDFVETDEWNEVGNDGNGGGLDADTVDADYEKAAVEAQYEEDYDDLQKEEAAQKQGMEDSAQEEKKSEINSTDMLAEDAIEQIHQIDKIGKLYEFVPGEDEEDRSTVRKAFKKRLKELEDELVEEDEGDDGDLFADEEPQPEQEASFGDFDDDFDETDPI